MFLACVLDCRKLAGLDTNHHLAQASFLQCGWMSVDAPGLFIDAPNCSLPIQEKNKISYKELLWQNLISECGNRAESYAFEAASLGKIQRAASSQVAIGISEDDAPIGSDNRYGSLSKVSRMSRKPT